MDGWLKRKADHDFEDIEQYKRRRPDAEHAVPFPAVGPLCMFEYQFQLELADGTAAADATADKDISAYATLEYGLCSESDQSSSLADTSSDADHSHIFVHYRPHTSVDEHDTLVLAQPQLSVQQPQLYKQALAEQCDYSSLPASSGYAQYARSDAYSEYTGYPPADFSAPAVPTLSRVAPAQPSFLGETPVDVLSSSSPITRRSNGLEVTTLVSGSELYSSSQPLAQNQQQHQQSVAYQHKQSYVDPRQVYWTPPPPPAYYDHNHVYDQGAAQDAPPLLPLPQQYSYRALHGWRPDDAPPSYAYSAPAHDPAYYEAHALSSEPFVARASPPSVDYQRALIVPEGRVIYACHLCEHTFDLPNSLGLHFRWHRRKEESELMQRERAEEHFRHREAQACIASTANALAHGGCVEAYEPRDRYSHRGWNVTQPQFVATTAADRSYASLQAPRREQQAGVLPGVAQATRYEEAQTPENATYSPVRALSSVPQLPYGALVGAGWVRRA